MDDVGETSETIKKIGKVVEITDELVEMVGDKGKTGMSETGEAADRQSEGIAAVHAGVVDPKVHESVSLSVSAPAVTERYIKCKNV